MGVLRHALHVIRRARGVSPGTFRELSKLDRLPVPVPLPLEPALDYLMRTSRRSLRPQTERLRESQRWQWTTSIASLDLLRRWLPMPDPLRAARFLMGISTPLRSFAFFVEEPASSPWGHDILRVAIMTSICALTVCRTGKLVFALSDSSELCGRWRWRVRGRSPASFLVAQGVRSEAHGTGRRHRGLSSGSGLAYIAFLYFYAGGNRAVHRDSGTHGKTRQCSP